MPLHVLVTGAGGFSGAEMTMSLLLRGYRVTAVVSSTRSRLTQDSKFKGALKILTGDLASRLALPNDIDAIVHAAARSAWPGVSADELVRSNIIATRQLIAHALRSGVRT